ncbi:MAG TPA: DUF4058 domain-containing protein, partial [Gemmataceae bacterium]|nr:DUF4058 domain-containing protein [Gemmataceae bacterium]
AGFGPDVLALQTGPSDSETGSSGSGIKLPSRPQTQHTAETEVEFYRRKKSSIAVRHVSGDRIAAMLEIASPGNKSSRYALRSFVDKACELLERRIHLLIVDPFPPGPRDPEGLHAAIWAEVEGIAFAPDPERPLTAVAYECDDLTRAYVETFAVGHLLPKMPLFLEADGCVMVPLEATYRAAFDSLPKRWQAVLSP